MARYQILAHPTEHGQVMPAVEHHLAWWPTTAGSTPLASSRTLVMLRNAPAPVGHPWPHREPSTGR
jgi:hypothetical protein